MGLEEKHDEREEEEEKRGTALADGAKPSLICDLKSIDSLRLGWFLAWCSALVQGTTPYLKQRTRLRHCRSKNRPRTRIQREPKQLETIAGAKMA